MIRSHVLICAGTGCTSSNSHAVKEALIAELAKKGLDKEIKVVQTGCFGLCALLPAQKGINVNARLLFEYGSHVVGENFFDSVCLFSLLRKKIKPRFAVLYFFGGPIATLFKPVFTDKDLQAANRSTN